MKSLKFIIIVYYNEMKKKTRQLGTSCNKHYVTTPKKGNEAM